MKTICFWITITFLGCASYFAFATPDNAMNLPKKTIIFGVGEANYPFSMTDAANHVYGFSISFTQLLCKALDVECIYKPMLLKELVPALEDGSIDAAVGGLAITKQRQQKFAFTLPYLPSKLAVLAKNVPEQARITDLTPQNIEGKIFGFQLGSAFFERLTNVYPNIKYKEFDTVSEIIEALAENTINFAVIPMPAANYWLIQTQDEFYLIPKTWGMDVGVGIMMLKSNQKLLNNLNQAILQVTKTSIFKDLLRTYFPYNENR